MAQVMFDAFHAHLSPANRPRWRNADTDVRAHWEAAAAAARTFLECPVCLDVRDPASGD